MADSNIKRLRLTRSIILAGEHAEAGEIHDVPRALAHRLIGEGSAVQHLEEGDEPEPAPATVNRMEHPGNADPPPQRVSGPPPKVRK
ncbi:MAG: hypothetical protein LAN84_00275 [Acidobacteriia bacterium]|nr:hypothetical protein [Terriglobia bacterium]